jgi:hypothetical protein
VRVRRCVSCKLEVGGGKMNKTKIQENNMKRFFAIAAFAVVIASLLVACGGGDSPETAVREWMQALLDMDGNKLIERTCEASQSDVQQAGALVSVLGIAGNEVGGQSAKADLSSLSFQATNKGSDTAQVHVQGKLRVAFMGLAQEQKYDQTIPVVLEDGKWKVCDLSASSPNASSSASSATTKKAITPTPQIQGGVKLIPLSVTKEDAGDGYAYINLRYAVENYSNNWASVILHERSSDAMLSTAEGFDYKVWGECNGFNLSDSFVLVPPGFRMRGRYALDSKREPTDEDVMQLKCKVGAKTSGYQLHLPYSVEFATESGSAKQEGMFDIKFDDAQNSLSTFISGDETSYRQSPPSGTLLLEPGEPLETPFGKISFDRLVYSVGNVAYPGTFMLHSTVINNNQGYELRFRFDDGEAGLFTPDGKYLHAGSQQVTIGPGQTKQISIGFDRYSGQGISRPPAELSRMCFAFDRIQYEFAQSKTGNQPDYVQPVVVCFPEPPVSE